MRLRTYGLIAALLIVLVVAGLLTVGRDDATPLRTFTGEGISAATPWTMTEYFATVEALGCFPPTPVTAATPEFVPRPLQLPTPYTVCED